MPYSTSAGDIVDFSLYLSNKSTMHTYMSGMWKSLSDVLGKPVNLTPRPSHAIEGKGTDLSIPVTMASRSSHSHYTWNIFEYEVISHSMLTSDCPYHIPHLRLIRNSLQAIKEPFLEPAGTPCVRHSSGTSCHNSRNWPILSSENTNPRWKTRRTTCMSNSATRSLYNKCIESGRWYTLVYTRPMTWSVRRVGGFADIVKE